MKDVYVTDSAGNTYTKTESDKHSSTFVALNEGNLIEVLVEEPRRSFIDWVLRWLDAR